ncbi:MAG: PRC-barrel domain-containing protein [Chloroflexota bacterium]|nr:PRC-barrel domain-containing protein [Chloroflexota bacterium]
MNSKHVKGLSVISIADGRRLGSVNHIFVDPVQKQVVGFSVSAGHGLLSSDPDQGLVVDAKDVHSLGPDALTLTDTSAARGDATNTTYGGLLDAEQLTKRKVLTEGGTMVGQIASLEFDPVTYRITGIEASPGFFKSNRMIPVEQVTNIGEELVVVSDAVCAGDPNDAAGSSTVTSSSASRFVVGDVDTKPA